MRQCERTRGEATRGEERRGETKRGAKEEQHTLAMSRQEKEPLRDPTKIAPANDFSRCLCGQLGVVFN